MKVQMSDRVRLVLMALGVAAIVVALIAVGIALIPAQYVGRIRGRWIRFVLVSAFLAWYELKAYRRVRRYLRFWAVFLGVFFVYVGIVGHFFWIGNGLSLVAFAATGAAQFACVALLVYWALGVGPEKIDLNV